MHDCCEHCSQPQDVDLNLGPLLATVSRSITQYYIEGLSMDLLKLKAEIIGPPRSLRFRDGLRGGSQLGYDVVDCG